MAKRNLMDLGDMLDLKPAGTLLDELGERGASAPSDSGSQVRIAVDFTFRLPPAILDEIRDMAREQGVTVNAMMAGLVDLGLQARGRPGIAARHPEYIAYLHRGRRGAA